MKNIIKKLISKMFPAKEIPNETKAPVRSTRKQPRVEYYVDPKKADDMRSYYRQTLYHVERTTASLENPIMARHKAMMRKVAGDKPEYRDRTITTLYIR